MKRLWLPESHGDTLSNRNAAEIVEYSYSAPPNSGMPPSAEPSTKALISLAERTSALASRIIECMKSYKYEE
jgi:hypothetical protein